MRALTLSIAAATLVGCSGLTSADAGCVNCGHVESCGNCTSPDAGQSAWLAEAVGLGLRPGAGTLSQAQLDALVTSLTRLTVTRRTFCGADKNELHLVALQPSGARARFKDDFYACVPEADTTVVDGMDAFEAKTTRSFSAPRNRATTCWERSVATSTPSTGAPPTA